MNLKRLEIFVAVAESGSFSKGADATFITQSTVSQHIAAMEKELGLKLLDRTSHGALLTEGGKLLLEHARKVISSVREIEPAMRRFMGLEEVELRIGGSNIPGDYMIPRVLPLFTARHPGVRLTLLQGDSREILNKVALGEVEIGIVGSRFSDEAFTFTPLNRDEIKLMAGKSHPLAAAKSIDTAILAHQEFIMREAGSGTAKTITEALTAVGIMPENLTVRARLGSNEAVKQTVAGGLGLSFFSEISILRELARGDLVEIHVKGVSISRHFYLVQRSGRELSPAADAFSHLIFEHYRQGGSK